MALPGTGFRSVWQLALEISFTLVEPYIATSLSTAVSAPGSQVVTVPSLGIPVPALYPGAQVIIDWNTPNQEIVQVTNVNVGASQFTAVFVFTHAIGASVISPTFPTQAASGDPFFTQSEILAYIARAQNQFLADCPCIFALNNQLVQLGQVYQLLACDAIEINRIAVSNVAIPITSITRTGNVCTLVSQSPHNLSVNSRFSIFDSPDPSFNGAFRVLTVLGPSSFTYTQYQPNASITSGFLGLWTRLWEMSQEELYMQNPNFRNQNITALSSWFEDRTGNYQFGVNGKPATSFPIEVLASIRDTDTLALTDMFLVPDICLHGVKYRALEYTFSKDGEMRDALRQAYCKMRADRVTLATRRYMNWLGITSELMDEMMQSK